MTSRHVTLKGQGYMNMKYNMKMTGDTDSVTMEHLK